MQTIKLDNNTDAVIKVELNDDGDFILLAANSATFFDNYIDFIKSFTDLTEEFDSKTQKIKEEYKDDLNDDEKIEIAHKVARQSVLFSEKATEIIDGFLGEGTIRKYFKVFYDNIPDFMPGEECFVDFITTITPVIETVYGKKVEIRANISKEKTKKYIPQDFKKKGNKC